MARLLIILAINLFTALAQEARGRRSFRKDAFCTIGGTCEPSPPFDIAVDYDSDFFWVPTAWNPCSKNCGGGTQTAALACYASNLTRVSASYCQDLPLIISEQSCNAFECPSYTVYRSPWSECSKSCGTGYQTRGVFCRDNFGSLVPPQNCGLEENYVESQQCNTDACDTSYWYIPPWNPCDAPCGGGKQKRIPTCFSSGSDVSLCTGEKPSAEKLCNTQACTTHAWLVGPWKPCPYACQATTERFVQCVDGYGFEQPDSECPGNKPAVAISCDQPHISCSDCLYDCFGNGACKFEKCSCNAGWTGKYCQTPKNCSGFLGYSDHGEARCCDLIDVDHKCCNALDKDGKCCPNGVIDSQGVCDGVATMIDFEGKPCSTIRDEKGICCASGALDECHICDGDGSSCSVKMTIYLNVTGSSLALQNQDSFRMFLISTMNLLASKLRIADEALSVSGLRMINADGEICNVDDIQNSRCFQNDEVNGLAIVNATVFPRTTITQRKDVLVALQPGPLYAPSLPVRSDALSASLLFVGDVGRTGVCGNGLCERGERCTGDGLGATTLGSSCCLQDCPYVSAPCPAPTSGPRRNRSCSGSGICLEASGQCDCFKGYAGYDCSSCASGWIQTPSGACVMLPEPRTLSVLAAAYKGVRKPAISKPPRHTSHHGKGIDTSGTIILLVLCGICLALLLLLIVAEHHQDRQAEVHPEPPPDPPGGGGGGGGGGKLAKWTSSSEYDVIPITPMRPARSIETGETTLALPTSPVGGKRLWSPRKLFFTARDAPSSSTGSSSWKSPREAPPSGLELQHSSSNFITTDEDLTEEEQAKMNERAKSAMRQGSRSAKFVTGYLTDSEDSDGSDGKNTDANTHCCTPDSPAIVRT